MRNATGDFRLRAVPDETRDWAAGTVPLLVRAMLGVEPDPETQGLLADPVLPEGVEELRLSGVPAFGRRLSPGA